MASSGNILELSTDILPGKENTANKQKHKPIVTILFLFFVLQNCLLPFFFKVWKKKERLKQKMNIPGDALRQMSEGYQEMSEGFKVMSQGEKLNFWNVKRMTYKMKRIPTNERGIRKDVKRYSN